MIEEKIKELGYSLTEVTPPLASYLPCIKSGNLIFLSGVISDKKGKLGKDLTTEDGYEESKKCAIKLLSNLKAFIKNLDNVVRIVKVEGYVNSTESFDEQSKVINGASNLLFDIFGELGKHSRVAIGVMNLPFNASIEISMIVEVKE
ncbi:MAG TPA: RidA family protein [Caldisericia bacterium]|nr:RidA family protein [Caldisericia bacterium]HPP43965.1 RidA family protein [Caldisericia bacterium]HRT37571.1 RidA family protein [Caldisericia bacterium]HRU74183.1 RidA family protein [Caldisericia bacterium]